MTDEQSTPESGPKFAPTPKTLSFTEYQRRALSRSSVTMQTDRSQAMICGALGLAGESGEFADTIKKIVFHDHPITDELVAKMLYELGDVLWYVSLSAYALGIDLETIALMNDLKLSQRYPNGFDPAISNAPREPDPAIVVHNATVAPPIPESPALEWTYEAPLDRYICIVGDYVGCVVPYAVSVRMYVTRTGNGPITGRSVIEEARFSTIEEAKARGERVLRMRNEADETAARG